MPDPKSESASPRQLDQLLEMEFTARLLLGGCTMEIADILNLGQGSVLELDSLTQEPLQLWVNDQMVAKAETVVVNEKFGARVVEVVAPAERLKKVVGVG